MSGPQRQFSGEPTCRLPNANMLGSRQVCSPTLDIRNLTAPTPNSPVADPDIAIGVRFVRKQNNCEYFVSPSEYFVREIKYSRHTCSTRPENCPERGRPVGSPAYRWGPKVGSPIAVGGPTCRLPRHCRNNLGQSS